VITELALSLSSLEVVGAAKADPMREVASNVRAALVSIVSAVRKEEALGVLWKGRGNWLNDFGIEVSTDLVISLA